MDLNEAIKVHVEWRIALRNAATFKEPVDIGAIERDDHCTFGKWLHGEGKRQYGETEAYKNLVVKHREFHEQAGEVGRAINSKQYEKACGMLKFNTPYDETSNAMIAAIQDMIIAIRKPKGL